MVDTVQMGLRSVCLLQVRENVAFNVKRIPSFSY